MKARDIVIGIMVLAILAALAWLFLRPVEPARQIVFGELGHHRVSTNAIVGGAGSETNPAAPGLPPASQADQALNDQSNRPADSVPPGPDGAMTNTNMDGAAAAANSSSSSNTGSNSPVAGPLTNDVSQNGLPPSPAPSSPEASNMASNSTPPPPAAYTPPEANTSPSGASYQNPWSTDPSGRTSTAELLAEAKAAGMAVNPMPARTADMLAHDTEPGGWFNPRAGSNVVFILDNSMNMRTNGKSFSARRELVEALQTMNARQLFYVLLFHSGGYEGMPSLAPIPATAENVRSMTNWLFSVGHRGGADPDKAMRRALGLAPAPDLVWLLAGSPLPGNVVDKVHDANAGPNARINTVGLYTHDGEQALRQIAGENRGAYRFVPPPETPSSP